MVFDDQQTQDTLTFRKQYAQNDWHLAIPVMTSISHFVDMQDLLVHFASLITVLALFLFDTKNISQLATPRKID